MGLVVRHGIGMAFHRGMRHGPLQILPRDAMHRLIGAGQLGEIPGVGMGRQIHRRQRPARGGGQPGKARVLELFHPHRQRDVHRARGHGEDRAAKCLRPARAEILDPGHADIRQAQCHGHRHARLARADVVVMRGIPGGADRRRLDPGPGQRFGIGLAHQLFLADVPALAEARAAHRQDRHLVLDAAGHQSPLPVSRTAFQK